MGPLVNKRRCKRGNDEADANALPKVLRKDHAAFRPAQIPLEGKSLASMGLESGSTFFTPATQETPADAKSLSDPDPLSLRNRNRTPSETLPSLLGKRPPRSSPEMLLPRRCKITKESHSQDSQTGLEDPSEEGRDKKARSRN
ncbi:hypothetical protein Tco_1179363 [Tanacetum coccineum]